MEKVRQKCGFVNGIDIGAMGSKGGLSLGWKGNSLINLKSFSSYHIDVEVQDNECDTKWRLTGFYGNPEERGRRESWNLLRQLSIDQEDPWVVIGDFNEITSSDEKKGGRRRSNRQMIDFRSTLKDCNLEDLGFKGRWFTWERGRQKSTNIRERLDRGVATITWIDLFPRYQVNHLSHSFSDHCPILLDTMGMDSTRGPNSQNFRFEARWCLDSNFEALIRNWWLEAEGTVPKRLEQMGSNMLKWTRVRNRDNKKIRNALEDRLKRLYNEEVSDDTLAEIAEIQLGLNLEADKEEIFWEQRARVNWLQHGDRNTSFFHKMAGQRHFRGRILELEDAAGNHTTESADMLKITSSYFTNLFSASTEESDEHLFGLVKPKVTASMNAALLKQFTEEEICQAVKEMPPLKAPGVDGFSATFFQTYWHIVGTDVSKYCLAILNGQFELEDINKTRLVLIPKVDKPINMTQFRPISLCNVLYKIIAKVLVNRMSDMLGDCINETQGAFIPGRLISDNILIAYEILHSLKMKKNGKKGHFALKLDMSKAYDRVEWDFLAGMMTALGFHNDWIVLIMRCVCSVSYSVSLNGLNRFATLLEDVKQRGLMEGAPIGRGRISINHLFFADESLGAQQCFAQMFTEAEEHHRNIIAISTWSLWYCRNKLMHEGTKTQMQEILGFIRGYMMEIEVSRKKLQPQVRPNLQELWRPPEIGIIKINFDASFQIRERLAITAVIARDAMGVILGAETYLVEDTVDSFVAEARACERAVLLAKSRGFQRLVVEGDALTVIKSIKRKNHEKSILKSITQHINQLGLCFDEISYHYVPRSANGVAHTLALEGRRCRFSGCWDDILPESIQVLAMKESRLRNVGDDRVSDLLCS
ncbi:reverse transcriptase [Gossypium australe]|uniref:Reverse transcriptase n=1 Tax=Gossypium australe TaxID=47621 RepID=A0A5B6W3W6_9ROSI|nr:reverse transcriptase [Gossypium australe]